MREIKFRAWDKKNKKMLAPLLLAEILWSVDGGYFYCDAWDGYMEEELVLMQYTGLKDKNGKEIYEGDIVCFDGFMTADNSFGIEPNGYIYDEGSVHIIVWNDKLAGWDLNFEEDEEWKYKRDTRCLLIDKSCEIIGNIWQNPELLEVTNENT